MPSLPSNRAIIAAAGSRKTQHIIDEALAAPSGRRVLITTFTRENCDQITQRLHAANGYVPLNVHVLSWFTFLMNQAARPYQSAVTERIDHARSLNFKGSRSRYTSRDAPLRYYFDSNADFYRDGLADFAVRADKATAGRVIRRLETLYDAVYLDEFQDLAGYDLDFLDLLFRSRIEVTVMGDPRQATYVTNQCSRNKQYRGPGIIDWLRERGQVCPIEERSVSWRCNQAICDWADRLYPDLARTTALNHERTGHDDVVCLARNDVPAYIEKFNPVILRWDRNTDTFGFQATNMRASKGCTYDRVMIIPTGPMRQYLKTGDLEALTSKAALYVAVTRARHSVAFVVSRGEANYVP